MQDEYEGHHRDLVMGYLVVARRLAEHPCVWCGEGKGWHRDECEGAAVIAVDLDGVCFRA